MTSENDALQPLSGVSRSHPMDDSADKPIRGVPGPEGYSPSRPAALSWKTLPRRM
jgi:hypothetical protein